MSLPAIATLNRVRRRLEERIDQGWTLARWKLLPASPAPPFEGNPRFAFLTVNCSTTRYLKLMLLTLCEQSALGGVSRIVICDNGSGDGGAQFVHRLADQADRVRVVENHHFLNHAHGMRRCISALESVEDGLPRESQSNLFLCCDPDVVFRNPETLSELGKVVVEKDAAFAGELRRNLYPYPEAQASFFVVRRDWYTHPNIVPWVNHGAPAYWMQRSIWQAGGTVVDFPSNHGGYILHRGRSAVAATRTYSPASSYATAQSYSPHFMGVPGGAQIWDEIETRYVDWLRREREPALIDRLAERFGSLGSEKSF